MILLISWSKRHLKWSKRLQKQTQKTGESLTCFFLCCVMSTWTHKERLFYIRGFLRRATTFSLCALYCITHHLKKKINVPIFVVYILKIPGLLYSSINRSMLRFGWDSTKNKQNNNNAKIYMEFVLFDPSRFFFFFSFCIWHTKYTLSDHEM